MSSLNSYRVKKIPRYRQIPSTKAPATKTTSKPFVCSPVLHFFCDFFKLMSLITGFLGVYIIYSNKQFWKNRRYTIYSIIAITSYCLVFITAVISFIQIKRIEFRQLHLLKMAFKKIQANRRTTKQKGANKKQSKIKIKYTRNKK